MLLIIKKIVCTNTITTLVISEHSSEDDIASSSFVGRHPTGGNSMGSRSFKEHPNSR